MEENCGELPPALERVRELFYSELTPVEGRSRIRAALAGATDPIRWRRIEALAKDPDMLADLLQRLQRPPAAS